MGTTTLVTGDASGSTWSTPRALRWMRLLLLLLDVALIVTISVAVREQHNTVHTLMTESVPGIEAAQRITAAMADMDADAGRSLRDNSTGHHDSTAAFEADRRQEILALLRAAETVRGEGQATAAIEALELQQGSYEQMLQRARDLHEQGAPATPVYGAATRLMDETLLPAGAALERTGRERLEGAFAQEEQKVQQARLLLGALLLITLCGLVACQVFLSQKTRRTLNMALLGATVWIAAMGLHLMRRSALEQEELAATRTASLEGVTQVGQARAAAHLAYRAEMHAILPGFGAADLARHTFALEADRVATVPAALSTEELANALWQRHDVPGLTGALPSLLSGPEQHTDRSDVIAALIAWQRLRAAVSSPRTDVADVAALNQQLSAFDTALNSAEASEGEALDRQAQATIAEGTGLALEAGITTSVMAGLLLLGINPRLREYL